MPMTNKGGQVIIYKWSSGSTSKRSMWSELSRMRLYCAMENASGRAMMDCNFAGSTAAAAVIPFRFIDFRTTLARSSWNDMLSSIQTIAKLKHCSITCQAPRQPLSAMIPSCPIVPDRRDVPDGTNVGACFPAARGPKCWCFCWVT